MPTPAKLVAAILFAALCWYVAELIRIHALPEGVRIGRFREFAAFGGLIIGWKYIGKVATGPTGRGTTFSRAITAGIGGAFVMMLLTLIVHSFWAMISESLGSKYTEVGLAMGAWIDFLLKDAQMLTIPIIPITLYAGGAIIGLVAGVTGRVTR